MVGVGFTQKGIEMAGNSYYKQKLCFRDGLFAREQLEWNAD
jgi:hypothetical protein